MKETKVKDKLKNQKAISTKHNPSVRSKAAMHNLSVSIENATDKKSTAGITLIALVITIIVLLILVGISIVTLNGQNGILTQASSAEE